MKARKPIVLAGLLAAMMASAVPAMAEEAAAAAAPAAAEPASPHSLSANIGFFSQYVFRGITYTDEQFAIQGGFDYAHASGFYAGLWATNVDQDALYGNTVELDLYAGYANTIGDTGIGYNVGVLQFYYPNNENIEDKFGIPGADESPNTTELNAAVSWKWLTLKYSYAVSNFFGIDDNVDGEGDSDGSDYIELNFAYTLPKDINLVAHVGHQRVEGRGDLDYTDFLVGVNKNFSIAGTDGWNAGINYTTTDADDDLWVDAKGSETGDDHVIVYLKRTF